MRYYCCDERRRQGVRLTKELNGIEFLEVVDIDAPSEAERQRILHVKFLNEPKDDLTALSANHVSIVGGTRVTGIKVESAGWHEDHPDVLVVRVDRPGDYSIYTLRIGEPPEKPYSGMDPLLTEVEFSFKIECPTEFDCDTPKVCPPKTFDEPEIDYLARDYASFRQLMLDRMSVIMPDWRERNAADLGIALVELLAYRADHLSYRLDAIGMESTLGSARFRSSARRHARLVDYEMHDGANARTWVQIRVSKDNVEIEAGTPLLTRVPGVDRSIEPASRMEQWAMQSGPVVFETMHDVTLHPELNEIDFYTWGDRECCLPAGSTSATLEGDYPMLDEGSVLVFVEWLGPQTGEKADANPAKRHAVRLLKAESGSDPIGSWFTNPDDPVEPVPVTNITWHEEDALPFPLCISIRDSEEPVSVALGNIVLADHGQTIKHPLPEAPVHNPRLVLATAGGGHCDPVQTEQLPPRYAPPLNEAPLTIMRTIAKRDDDDERREFKRFDESGPAADAIPRHLEGLLPDISLLDKRTMQRWYPRRDLLSSGPSGPNFVAEVDLDGRATLRFGDSEYGLRPRPDTELNAIYRVGNGPAGNIGADSLNHIITEEEGIEAVSNPLPGIGGVAPESIEHVRRTAPHAFRVQQRAVTPRDYEVMTDRHPQVHRAVATERWTGSWYTVFLTIDRRGGLEIDPPFEKSIRRHLERYRMAGHDLEIDRPRFVFLEVELRICVLPDYYRGDVRREVLEVLSSGVRPDGSQGLFHPDRFSFGQTVYLSQIYAAAQEVEGVRFVEALVFQRYGDHRTSGIEDGELEIGRLEIARLDNDPSFPERGDLRLKMEGGR
jgi:hypothetical protein